MKYLFTKEAFNQSPNISCVCQLNNYFFNLYYIKQLINAKLTKYMKSLTFITYITKPYCLKTDTLKYIFCCNTIISKKVRTNYNN